MTCKGAGLTRLLLSIGSFAHRTDLSGCSADKPIPALSPETVQGITAAGIFYAGVSGFDHKHKKARQEASL